MLIFQSILQEIIDSFSLQITYYQYLVFNCILLTPNCLSPPYNKSIKLFVSISNFELGMIIRVLLVSLLILSINTAADIMHFGAVPHSDNVRDHFKNQKAIHQAIQAANASTTDRVVRIPAKTFYSMPFKIENMHNITFQILGRLSASKNVKFWPRQAINKRHWNFIQINNCTNIEISGGGKIDGRGYHWWMILFLNDKKYINNQDDRPHLINIVNGQFIKIHDIILKNSPQFHLKMDHCHDAEIYNVNILVNTTAQINLLKKLSLEGTIVMFPFNTDGIDPSGGRMHIYNLTVQNWDDVVVPKPSSDVDCTRDMLIQNVEVVLGVGMTIGSVPPAIGGHCIRNITFRNVYQKRPLKGIYVKTNPGDTGYGNISDIYYKNFTMDRPVWWAIYIGPQQMKQPDGDGPGCMLYPFDKKGTCQTQPRVTLKNITLEDIRIHKSLLYPVTIRCNVSNPCTQINFINVKVDEWEIGQKNSGNVCQFASGKGLNNVPKINCLTDPVTAQNQQHKQLSSDQENQKKEQELDAWIQQIKEKKSAKEVYEEMVNLSKFYSNEKKYVLMRLVEQIQAAAHEVGYHDKDDDEFMYNLKELQAQFQDLRSLEQLIKSHQLQTQ